jgi:spore germination protein YaaH
VAAAAPGILITENRKGACGENPANRPKAVVIRTRRKPEGLKKLIAAVALVAYLVQPGDTLSGIAASHGTSLAAVQAANTKLANPDMIYAGQTVSLPEGSSAAQGSATSQSATTQGSSQSAASGTSSSTSSAATTSPSTGSSGSSSSSLSSIPGVPQSFAACVAYRESTNLQNPAANGNAYGIIPASGYNVSGTSLAHQKQVFADLYQQDGASPWAADGC